MKVCAVIEMAAAICGGAWFALFELPAGFGWLAVALAVLSVAAAVQAIIFWCE